MKIILRYLLLLTVCVLGTFALMRAIPSPLNGVLTIVYGVTLGWNWTRIWNKIN